MRLKMLKNYFFIFFIFVAFVPTTFASSIFIVDSSEEANYISIQEAIDSANTGDIVLVYPGIYEENIRVIKELIIKTYSDNPDDTIVQPANPKDDIFYITANNVTINGFHIKGAGTAQYHYEDEAGIYIEGCSGVTIVNNKISTKISTDSYGVYAHDSENNQIFDNNITMCRIGIFLWNSSNNKVNNNYLSTHNHGGILLHAFSDYNEIVDNYVFNTYAGTGLMIEDSCNHNILRNNTVVNSKGGIYVFNSDYNYIAGNLANTNDWAGIYLSESNFNSLINNTAKFNDESGIILKDSSDNVLSFNHASNNSEYGIFNFNQSQNNTFNLNIAVSNGKENINLSSSQNNKTNDSENKIPFPGFLFTYIVLIIASFMKKDSSND